MTTQVDRRFDLSGGIQTAPTWLLRKPNEVEDAVNGRFDSIIGAVVRRYGYVKEGSALQSGKRGLGLHEAKLSAGARILSAINDSGDTTTNIKIYDATTDTWSNMSLPSSVDPDTRMQFIDTDGETYAAGKSTSTGDRMTLLNFKDASTVSDSRNLINAPKARFIAKFGASLYAINVEVGGTVYPNRAYKSSPAMGIITFTQGEQDVFDTILVDTVRYLKAGMAIDIYTAGTNTKLLDVSIISVDKSANTITCSVATNSTFATSDVNTTTDVITVGRNIATGTPIKFTSTGSVPTGLTAGTVYYAINSTSTAIKVATSADNATAGTAIDITATGSGTMTISSGIHIPDNDEVWLDGRHGERCYLWNTDYPTEADAEFLEVPAGRDSDTEITGWAKGNNRLFLYTKNYTMKYDGANPVDVYEDVGCISHETIQNIGDWLIWLDAEGRIRARNDATGQDEIISRGIENGILKLVPRSNLTDAAAGKINNMYKICLGSVGGHVLRLCYDFDSNTWAHERHALSMTDHIRSDFNGDGMRLYFVSDSGQMYLDEEGNDDDGVTIPLIVTLGRTNHQVEQQKDYHGVYVFGYNCTGAIVKASMDGGDWRDAGSLKGQLTKVALSTVKQKFSGRDINIQVSISATGAAPRIEGIVYYFNQAEDKFGQPT